MDTFGASKMLDLQSYFEDRMARFEADLQKRSSPGTGSLADEFSVFKTFVLQTLKSLSQQLAAVAREVDNLEMRSRRKMLLLHGVDEQKSEEALQVVTELVKERLKISTFTPEDISRCHTRQVTSDKPRPLLVKFQCTAVRDSIWYSKTKLKGTGATLSEFLTRSRHAAFMAAREKFGVKRCWTRQGCVYILAPDGKRYKIASAGDLSKISVKDSEKPPTTKAAPAKSKRGAAGVKK